MLDVYIIFVNLVVIDEERKRVDGEVVFKLL